MAESVAEATRLRRLQQLTDAALTYLELPQLLGALLARTTDVLEVDTCAVLLLDQLKLNFIAIASHELRTPAAAVFGTLATLVGRGDQLSPETREQLLRVGYEQ